MDLKPISVGKLSQYIKQIFEAEEMLHNIKIFGEISGFNISRGTAYFNLKDGDSLISCIMFDIVGYEHFSNGDAVMLTGTPRYYGKSGKLNFYTTKIEPYGVNVLFQQFLELRAKLEGKGYFLPELKKPIPKNLKRIGVVSSETGAVIQDIINVISRRNKTLDIVLYPVRVQGVGSEFEIAKGIDELDKYEVDVIIVARGGGSYEDLMSFNSEIVADSVFNAKKPIISAVGHETDFSICDFCADLRAPTPSAAAELVSEEYYYQSSKIIGMINYFKNAVNKYILLKQSILVNNTNNLISRHYDILKNNNIIKNNLTTRLNYLIQNYINNRSAIFCKYSSKLEKLNPKEVLKLGYAKIKDVFSVNQIQIGQSLTLLLKDGEVKAIVEDVKNKE